jgi:hypothetical protein
MASAWLNPVGRASTNVLFYASRLRAPLACSTSLVRTDLDGIRGKVRVPQNPAPDRHAPVANQAREGL